jgi:hypothetical protein
MVEALSRSLRQALKRRFVLAAVVGGVVFSSAYAFAATLNITTKTLGAGNTSVTACTSSTLQASYTVAFQGGTSSTAIGSGASAWTVSTIVYGNIVSGNGISPWAGGQYYVDSITVTPTTGTLNLTACANMKLTVDVLGTANADLAQYTTTLGATPGTSWTFGTALSGGTGVGSAIPAANAVAAAAVNGIAVAISG